jgi:hypothetical protein
MMEQIRPSLGLIWSKILLHLQHTFCRVRKVKIEAHCKIEDEHHRSFQVGRMVCHSALDHTLKNHDKNGRL